MRQVEHRRQRPGSCLHGSALRYTGPADARHRRMHNSNLVSSAILAGALLLPVSARADEPVPATAATNASSAADTPPETALRSQPHRHDGFYLRLSTGFGPYNESISQERQDPHTTVSGVAT